MDNAIPSLVSDASAGINFVTSLPTDVLILVGATITLALYGVQLGKYRLVALLFALFPAAIATPLLSPYLEGILNADLARSIVFIGFTLIAHVGFSHIVCCEFSGGAGSIIEGVLFGVLITGTLLSLGFTIDALDGVRAFSDLVRHYTTGGYALLWIVGSITATIVTARRF